MSDNNPQLPKPKTLTDTKSTFGVRSVSNGQQLVFQRDFAYAFPLIFKNTTILTETAIRAMSDPEDLMNKKLLVLDTLAQFFIRLWKDARIDFTVGVQGVGQFIDYVQASELSPEDQELRKQICSLFSNFLLVNIFTYMFSSKAMSIASPTSIDEACYNIEIFSALLSMVDSDSRATLVGAVKRASIIPSGINFTEFIRTSKDYLEDIKKEQEQLYGISVGSEK